MIPIFLIIPLHVAIKRDGDVELLSDPGWTGGLQYDTQGGLTLF